MSYIAYPFFRPSIHGLMCGNVHILLPADIAVMKMIAISQRGRKRDFIDLFWYCTYTQDSLSNIMRRTIQQYPEQNHNINHFLKLPGRQ